MSCEIYATLGPPGLPYSYNTNTIRIQIRPPSAIGIRIRYEYKKWFIFEYQYRYGYEVQIQIRIQICMNAVKMLEYRKKFKLSYSPNDLFCLSCSYIVAIFDVGTRKQSFTQDSHSYCIQVSRISHFAGSFRSFSDTNIIRIKI